MTIEYKNNDSFIDGISLKKIAGDFGTPCFIYSHNDLVKNFSEIKNVFASEKRKVFYSVKANSNLSILKVLLELGAGFDIVSLGELERVIKIGAQPEKIIYSGVGKSEEEIIRSLEYGIHCFNVESFSELERINSIAAKLNKVAPVSIRINPNIDPGSHEFISTGVETTKFGINLKNMMDAFIYANNEKSIELLGIDYHIGSQIESLDPFKEAIISVKKIVDQLKENNINIKLIDMGGGLGINYQNNDAPSLNDFGKTINQVINDNELSDYDFIIELGRSIVGNVGYILTSVEYIKKDSEKNFVIVDAGMDNLIRPCLYNSKHKILNSSSSKDNGLKYDIVGPVCECSDFLGKDVEISAKQDDLICIYGCGAYVSSMSSNYNSRLKAAEIIIINDKCKEIRKRDTYEQLTENEILI